jgi:xanthine/uracil/vitamin C permease (AzgA family)
MERTPHSNVFPERLSRVLKVTISIIIGVFLALLCANVVGVLEVSLLRSIHADIVLLALGGFSLRTSMLLFLVTLILIIFCLVTILIRILKKK